MQEVSSRTMKRLGRGELTYSSQSSNINAGQMCWNLGSGFVSLAEPVETGVRDWYTRFLQLSLAHSTQRNSFRDVLQG